MNLFFYDCACVKLRYTLRALRSTHATALGVALLLAAVPELLAAEGPISATQEALKREALYEGEPTGVLDAPTRAALRRFQILHALPVSGEIDTPTLQALEKRATPAVVPAPVEVPAPSAPEAPAPPPEVVEGDRQFLKAVEITGGPSPMNSEPAPTVATPPSVSAEPAEPSPEPPKTANARTKPAAAKKRPVEKGREETIRVERALPADAGETPQAPILESFTDRESDLDVTAGSGVKVTRTTTTTGRDGRTQISKKNPPAVAASPGPEVVEVPVPVARARRPNFFERLFHRSPD